MLRTDAHAGTSGDQAEPTIASELDTFNVALNKQLQVSTDTVQAQHSVSLILNLSMLHEAAALTQHAGRIARPSLLVSRQLLLQGDPRDAIINFVREEGLDLLLVGRSLGGRFKKVLRCSHTLLWAC